MNRIGAPRLIPEKQVFPTLPARCSFVGVAREQRMTTYSELLKDPRWQRRRLEILQRSDFRCENCEASDKTLHVHHKLYRKGAMPWEYQDNELVALCHECHERDHDLRKLLAESMLHMPDYDLERLLGYAQAMSIWGFANEGPPIKVRNAEHAQGISDVVCARGMGAEEVIQEMVEGHVSSSSLQKIYNARKGRVC